MILSLIHEENFKQWSIFHSFRHCITRPLNAEENNADQPEENNMAVNNPVYGWRNFHNVSFPFWIVRFFCKSCGWNYVDIILHGCIVATRSGLVRVMDPPCSLASFANGFLVLEGKQVKCDY